MAFFQSAVGTLQTLVPLLSGLFYIRFWFWGGEKPCPGGKEEIIEQHNSADY